MILENVITYILKCQYVRLLDWVRKSSNIRRFTSRKPLKEIKCILKELVMDAACEKRASKKQSCCPSTSILGSCPKEPACPPPPPPCPPKPCPPKPDCEKYFDRLYPAPTKRSFGYGKHEVGRGRTREVQPLGPDVDSMNKDRSRTRGHQLVS
jgi:hypothetical protein